jgi:uncharacterized Ntn-hydrolase superfamily protein
MTDKALAALAAGFKAGGKTGFAQSEQIGALRHVLADEGVASETIDKAVATIKDSGILNASQSRQTLVKLGLLAEKIDKATLDKLTSLLE